MMMASVTLGWGWGVVSSQTEKPDVWNILELETGEMDQGKREGKMGAGCVDVSEVLCCGAQIVNGEVWNLWLS